MHPVISPCAIPRLDEAGFEEKVLASPLPVFVQFVEGECRDCDLTQRSLLDVLNQFADRACCYCVQAPSNVQLTGRYHVSQVPTILLFRNGRVSRRLIGHALPGQLETILRGEIAPLTPKT
jgi:thioredoxin 1